MKGLSTVIYALTNFSHIRSLCKTPDSSENIDKVHLKKYFNQLFNSSEGRKSKRSRSKNLKKYDEYLKEVAASYPHVQELMNQYPKLNQIMLNNSFVREILLTKPGDVKAVEIIPKYLNGILDMMAESIQSTEKLGINRNRPIEERYALYGEEARNEHTDSQFELLAAFFESNILCSSLPERLLEQEIQHVKIILGHLPTDKKKAQDLYESSNIMSYSSLDITIIQDTDKRLIAGKEQEMADYALENEDIKTVQYITITKAFQKYLNFLENYSDPYLNLNVEEESMQDEVTAEPDPNKKLTIKSLGKSHEQLLEGLNKAFFVLKNAGLLEGSAEGFKSIFMPDVPLVREVRWLGDNKDLRFFLYKLLGKEFTYTNQMDVEMSIDANDNLLLFDGSNNELGRVISNCFLNKDGEPIKGENVVKPRSSKLITRDKVDALISASDVIRKI